MKAAPCLNPKATPASSNSQSGATNGCCYLRQGGANGAKREAAIRALQDEGCGGGDGGGGLFHGMILLPKGGFGGA